MFVGRIYDLSIIGVHFETYDDLARHAHCKYAFHSDYALSMLTRSLDHLGVMIDDEGLLRKERNSRLHHGSERGFSSDDEAFRSGSSFEHRANGLRGPNGKLLPVKRFFGEGLVELQKEFNAVMRKAVKQLDRLYDMLKPDFEGRFSSKFREGPFVRAGRA